MAYSIEELESGEHIDLIYNLNHDDDFGYILFNISGLRHCDILSPFDIRETYTLIEENYWVERTDDPRYYNLMPDVIVQENSFMTIFGNIEFIAIRPKDYNAEHIICHAQPFDSSDNFMLELRARVFDSHETAHMEMLTTVNLSLDEALERRRGLGFMAFGFTDIEKYRTLEKIVRGEIDLGAPELDFTCWPYVNEELRDFYKLPGTKEHLIQLGHADFVKAYEIVYPGEMG